MAWDPKAPIHVLPPSDCDCVWIQATAKRALEAHERADAAPDYDEYRAAMEDLAGALAALTTPPRNLTSEA